MARKRMISPEIWESESFSELTDVAKIVFISLFSHADDEGRGRADTSLIKSMTFPYDETRRVADIKSALSEIARSMSVQFYSVNGKDYYFMTSWKKWQKVDKPSPSKFPPPPTMGEGGAVRSEETFGEDSGNIRGTFGEDSATNRIERNRNRIEYPPCIPPTGETDGTDEKVTGYLEFMREHPYIIDDFNNPSELYGMDFELLSRKIAESSRFLQGKSSLKWLIRHYSEIVGDGYKDFSRPASAQIGSGKGDLQLWQELLGALRSAKSETYCAETGYNYPLYAMKSGEAKTEMAKIYKGLSPEIISYFDPNSFLEVCRMEEKDLKYERARFLKALPEIKSKLSEG